MAEAVFDVEDYEDDYYDDYEQDSGFRITGEDLKQLYTYCIKITVSQSYTNLIVLFACCAIYRIASNAIRTPDTSHILSSAIGTYMLYIYFKWDVFHTLGLISMSYLIILYLSNKKKTRGYVTGVVLIIYLVVCEKVLVDSSTWMKIRGPQMIAAMKIISLAFDLDSQSVLRADIFEYAGYTLCPGSCVWGPWISFNEYKTKQERIDEDYWWIFKGIVNALLSLFYFVTSTCVLEFLMPNTWGTWWTVYRDALIFRMSHYFVSSVSEASCSFSGYKDKLVSSPWKVEYPRSLLDVVIHWNIPTHKFLKNYIFKTTLTRWGAFFAVMMTYLISSLLHGLNPKLAAVLLSLGFYTYTEHSLRSKMSKLLDSCIDVRSCPPRCLKHTHNQYNLIVNLINITLSLVAMFHLAYLGSLMDTSPPDLSGTDLEYPLARWHSLEYISHWIVLLTFSFNLFLSIFRF